MNKILLFLVFASFALIACSEDNTKKDHIIDSCQKKPITKNCLIGKWYLKRVEKAGIPSECDAEGRTLVFKKNGEYSFEGGFYDFEVNGIWSLDAENLDITCKTGDCSDFFYEKKITAEAHINGSELQISYSGGAAISQCRPKRETSEKFTEVFSWQGD